MITPRDIAAIAKATEGVTAGPRRVEASHEGQIWTHVYEGDVNVVIAKFGDRKDAKQYALLDKDKTLDLCRLALIGLAFEGIGGDEESLKQIRDEVNTEAGYDEYCSTSMVRKTIAELTRVVGERAGK